MRHVRWAVKFHVPRNSRCDGQNRERGGDAKWGSYGSGHMSRCHGDVISKAPLFCVPPSLPLCCLVGLDKDAGGSGEQLENSLFACLAFLFVIFVTKPKTQRLVARQLEPSSANLEYRLSLLIHTVTSDASDSEQNEVCYQSHSFLSLFNTG